MEASSLRGSVKSAVIIPYFGSFGPWFPLFLDSLSRQSIMDCLLVTDAETPPLPVNVRRVKMTLPELRALAEEKLQTKVNLVRAYKLCDLKPAYGLVFEEFLQGYDYWAFGDEDVFYGALDSFLGSRLAHRPDLVVPNYRMTIGHFTLVRNSFRINRLILEDPNYLVALADEANCRYDEAGCHDEPPSFTHTVKSLEESGQLTVDWGLPVQGNVPYTGKYVVYDGEKLKNSEGTELAYYHWGKLRCRGWKFPSVKESRRGFALDSLGFYPVGLGRERFLARRIKGLGAGAVRKFVRDVSRLSPF